MIKNKNLARIFIPGGLLSPGDFRKIVMTAHHFGSDFIHLSSRQEILFNIDKKYKTDLDTRFQSLQYDYEFETDQFNNIVSSYPAIHIQSSTGWMSEGMYHDIHSSFDFIPFLKVNIIDPIQSMLPLFTGNLNFIASPHINYWYLYIKLYDKINLWPVLVDGAEIAELVKVTEMIHKEYPDISFSEIEERIYNFKTWNFRIIDIPLKHPDFRFPYYEGFHPQKEEKFWLGIYMRDNSWPIKFMDVVSGLCMQTNNNSICLTPWKSILVKNIAEKDIPLWEALLGSFGINTGHSSFELHWQLPDLDPEAYNLKKYICRSFDEKGLRTEGLVFGIKSEASALASSVLIERKSRVEIGGMNLFKHYTVSYKKNFDINSEEEVIFATYVLKENLPGALIYICELYYKTLNNTFQSKKELSSVDITGKKKEQKSEVIVHQCKECLTVYDPLSGDELSGIIQGTEFTALPIDFRCPLCDSSKASYVPVNRKSLTLKV
jgi:rubredoxin